MSLLSLQLVAWSTALRLTVRAKHEILMRSTGLETGLENCDSAESQNGPLKGISISTKPGSLAKNSVSCADLDAEKRFVLRHFGTKLQEYIRMI